MLYLLSPAQRKVIEKPQYKVNDFLNGKFHPGEFLKNFPPYEFELINQGVPKPFVRALINIAKRTINPKFTAKEQANFDSRSIISKEWAQECVHFLKEIIDRSYSKQNMMNSIRRNINGVVYGYSTYRMSRSEIDKLMARFDKKHLNFFNDTMKMLEFSFRTQGFIVLPGEGDFYTQVNGKIDASDALTITQNKKDFWINFKEYFTFVPVCDNADEILSEVIRFYEAIFQSFLEIQQLSIAYGIAIKMKYKNNLGDFLKSLDNLVVYTPSPKAGAFIRKIVNKNLEKLGIYAGRKDRAESGFDFMTGTSGFSHSRLIAMAVAEVFVKDYLSKKEYGKYSERNLEVMIKGLINNFGSMPPKKFLTLVSLSL